jgi:hypothetical protein
MALPDNLQQRDTTPKKFTNHVIGPGNDFHVDLNRAVVDSCPLRL